jgi:hypothetical protein
MANEDESLFPENLIIGQRYSYLNNPSDYSMPGNAQIQRRESKLIGKRFFKRNRRDPMYEIPTNKIRDFRAYITEYNVAVELRFENGDVLTVRRSEDEDEREDGTYRNFINKYNFSFVGTAAAAAGRNRKQKTKRKLGKYLKTKKSKKRV